MHADIETDSYFKFSVFRIQRSELDVLTDVEKTACLIVSINGDCNDGDKNRNERCISLEMFIGKKKRRRLERQEKYHS